MIIDNQDQLELLFSTCEKSDIFIIPVFLDDYNHLKNNAISTLYFYCISSKTEFLLPIDHHDKIIENISLESIQEFLKNNKNKIFCISKKDLLYFFSGVDFIDFNLMLYLEHHKTIKENSLFESINHFYEHIFGRINKSNYLVPILKHLEYCQTIKNLFLSYPSIEINKSLVYYNDIAIPILYHIESNGLFYDKELFKTFLPSKTNQLKFDYLYSQYSLLTTTGRPTNKFGGINFSALNKKSGIRQIFISRFNENGSLIEFDFDAYHLQIIANEIGYEFPKNINLHTYLGRQYFGKDELTDEEYKQSKEISFRLLYGGIDKEFEKIDFFAKVNSYINIFYNDLKDNGFVYSSLFKRKFSKESIENFDKYKAWNYFIQLLETENSIYLMYRLLQQIKEMQSKLILYTYDSFLFDVLNSEKDELIKIIKKTLETHNFHLKVKEGKNYNDLILFAK